MTTVSTHPIRSPFSNRALLAAGAAAAVATAALGLAVLRTSDSDRGGNVPASARAASAGSNAALLDGRQFDALLNASIARSASPGSVLLDDAAFDDALDESIRRP